MLFIDCSYMAKRFRYFSTMFKAVRTDEVKLFNKELREEFDAIIQNDTQKNIWHISNVKDTKKWVIVRYYRSRKRIFLFSFIPLIIFWIPKRMGTGELC